MGFHWNLRDSRSPQISKTLVSVLAVLNNVVVWIVYTPPLSSRSSSPFNNPLLTVPKAPVTIGIIVTFMFHSFFNSLARLRYLSFFSLYFSFILWLAGTAKSTILQVLFFFFLSFFFFFFLLLLIIIRSGLLAEIRWSVCMSKSHRSLFIIIIININIIIIIIIWVFFTPVLVDGFHWSWNEYFAPKLFCFFCIRLLICPWALVTKMLAVFSFVIFECPVLFVLLGPIWVSFESPFFCQFIWIFFFLLCCQICLLLSSRYFFIRWVLAHFISLCSFAGCRSFFICPSILIFYSGFRIPLRWCLFYHWLVLLLHRLTRSILWCCLFNNL